jgi:hypothetical protein
MAMYTLGYIFLKGKTITIQALGDFHGNQNAIYHTSKATVVDNAGLDLPVGTIMEDIDFFLNPEVAHYFDLPIPHEGPYKTWYSNGNLEVECNFKDSLLDGIFRSWYEDGTLEEESFYKNGELFGEFKKWDEKGNLFKQ